jgi:hypothetical protein
MTSDSSDATSTRVVSSCFRYLWQEVDERKNLDKQVASFAEDSAAKEEAAFTSALAKTRHLDSSISQASAGTSERRRHTPAPAKRSATDGVSLREAALRRIEAARKYSASKTSPGSVPAGRASGANPTPATEREGQAKSLDTAKEWGRGCVGNEKEVCHFVLM